MPEEKPDLIIPDPAEIDVETLEIIHRHHDGFISFVRKVEGGGLKNVGGFTIREVVECLPELVPYLMRDAYFSINASYRAAPWKNSITGFPDAYRREIWLKWLTACYVDLDCYTLSYPDAVNVVMKAQEENIIPPASIIVRSGRGMYLLWLLRGEGDNCERAWPVTITLYKNVLRAMQTRLQEFNAALRPDRAASDAARVLRVFGSINSKAEAPVVAQVQAVRGGVVPAYDLRELAKRFGVWESPELPQRTTAYLSGSGRAVLRPGSCPARRAGRITSGHNRIVDLHEIAEYRGKIKRGKRASALTYYCEFAKAADYDLQATIRGMETFARELCDPPYPSDPDDMTVREIVGGVFGAGIKRLRSAPIARFFEITPAEARELGLRSIIPQAVREERKRARVRDAKRDARREVIWQMLKDHPGDAPTVRKIAERLRGSGMGIVSHRNIVKDRRDVLSKYRQKIDLRRER